MGRDAAGNEPAVMQSPLVVGSEPVKTSACLVNRHGAQAREIGDLGQISDILKETDSFVWLDVADPGPGDLKLIQEEFGLHPLAVEDAVKAHQRPKLEAYDDAWFIVVHGATRAGDELRIHEIAIFVGARYVVTVRDEPLYPVDEIQRRWHGGNGVQAGPGALLYTILDTVVDGYTPIAEAFEDRVEELEGELLRRGTHTESVLLAIYEMKKELHRFRRAVVPMRDILTPIMRGDVTLLPSGDLPYFRDVYDHVARAVDLLDDTRDLVNNARDTHISMASHRQNEVSKQLTIVATVFLPLTFITGFFGQNFGWLVNHITSTASFVELGVGSEIVAFAALLWYFRYKHWF
jgi:magnesium transporter